MKHESRRATRAALGVVCLLASAVVAGAQTVPEPWSARDIGQPVLAGASDFSSGVFRIDAAGEDVWGLSDQFHFVYQAFSGDVDIRARVESVAMAHTWSKAGVMIRGSLDADAPHGLEELTRQPVRHRSIILYSGAAATDSCRCARV